MHAGIDFQPAVQRLGQAGLFQPLQLQFIVDGDPQAQLGALSQFLRLEHALQQQYRGLDAGIAQFHGFLDAGHCECISQPVQCRAQ